MNVIYCSDCGGNSFLCLGKDSVESFINEWEDKRWGFKEWDCLLKCIAAEIRLMGET